MDDKAPQGDANWIDEFNLSLEDTVACENIYCDIPATHFSHLSCCGQILVACMPCFGHTQMGLVFMAASGQLAICRGCGQASDPLSWIAEPKEL